MSPRIVFGLLVPFLFANAALADEPATVMARRGKLLVSDDFERTEVGDAWKVSVRSYSIKDGVFITGQRPEAKHPAVSRLQVPFRNAVVDFSFKFTGGKQITLVFNDKAFQGSHAGHICRAGVSPTQISLGDDCEGTMKFGIYERWQDPAKRAEVEELVKDRMKKVSIQIDAERWHRMTVELVGDEMVASLDGKPMAYLKSPGIAHAIKSEWGFTTQGRTIEVDNLHAWAAEADPAWPQRRAKLFTDQAAIWGGKARLAADGQALADVVVAEKATPRVQAAAENLAKMLSRISGATFKVVPGNGQHGLAVGLPADFTATNGLAHFDLGNPKYREDYALKSHSAGAYLVGATELAVEHAVWDFLYRLGYRQFFPNEHWEIVPQSRELEIGVDVVEHPDFYSRSIWYGYGPTAESKEPYARWCARNRATSGIELHTGHSYDGILAHHKQEFAEHPEYLGLLDGKRQSTKFCISNPGLRQLVIDDALAYFASDPKQDCISRDPSDGGDWCECAECAKLGSISDRALLLANETALAVRAKYPGKLVGMYAYNFHAPPPNIRVEPGVVIGVATAFIKGNYKVEDVVAGWQRQGAEIGIRDYLGVFPWDHCLPGQGRGASTEYVRTSFPHFQQLGARFYSTETNDSWASLGLGHYLATRLLWDVDEASRLDELIDDFIVRSFGSASEPMKRFFQLIDGSKPPLLSDDLVGRMYRLLAEARSLAATDEGTQARLDDLVAYTRYVELWRSYTAATGSERQTAFEQLLRFAWRVREREIVHLEALWRKQPAMDKAVNVPEAAVWQVSAQKGNPWKQDPPVARSELEAWLTAGIERNKLLEFTPVSFSRDLVPATPLRLAPVATGSIGIYGRGTIDYFTWVEKAPAKLQFKVLPGRIYSDHGDAKLALFPLAEAEDKSVATLSFVPDKQEHQAEMTTNYDGLHRLEVSDRTAGTQIHWPEGIPLTLEASPEHAATLGGRWSLYFYVPRGTSVVGGYSTGPGTLLDSSGKIAYTFPNSAGYFHVAVPPGQDARLWRFQNSAGLRYLMTVPPYLARNERELLLPREVVEAAGR